MSDLWDEDDHDQETHEEDDLWICQDWAHQGPCYGCDVYAELNDLGLCGECNAKLDRDLIRQRDWAYSQSAFGVPPDQREALRNEVIFRYGKKLELIADGREAKNRKKKGNAKRRSRKQRKH